MQYPNSIRERTVKIKVPYFQSCYFILKSCSLKHIQSLSDSLQFIITITLHALLILPAMTDYIAETKLEEQRVSGYCDVQILYG